MSNIQLLKCTYNELGKSVVLLVLREISEGLDTSLDGMGYSIIRSDLPERLRDHRGRHQTRSQSPPRLHRVEASISVDRWWKNAPKVGANASDVIALGRLGCPPAKPEGSEGIVAFGAMGEADITKD